MTYVASKPVEIETNKRFSEERRGEKGIREDYLCVQILV